jgi:hypothetical protein
MAEQRLAPSYITSPGTSGRCLPRRHSMSILFSNIRVVPSTDSGTGGLPFECHPPHPSFALTGLIVRAGAWIDQVTPIFAELREDGTLGREAVGPAFGGFGGAVQHLRVSPGHVVTGLQTRSGNFIDGIRLLETRWEGQGLGKSTWTPWLLGSSVGGVERPERIFDGVGPGAHLVVGIAGRSGAYVDNLTIITAELERVTTTQVTHTGRGAGKNASPQMVG